MRFGSKGLNPLNLGVMLLVLVAFFAMLPVIQQVINDTVPELNSTGDQLIVRAAPAIFVIIAFISMFVLARTPEPEV